MSSFLSRAHGLYTGVFAAIEKSLGGDVLAVLARLTLAGIFWRSLLTKVETVKLFKYTEYINDFPVERAHVRLPDFPLQIRPATYHQFNGDFALPLIPGELAALMATVGEFILPILLVLGLATRFAAAGLMVMTLVIQFFVYPEAWWGTHAMWAVIALYLMAKGPGRLSLDHMFGNRFASKA
ncbi:DoxX family protein [Maricaulis sp.]|uniref:DoxX family protein n=1 Tax=unclassified Maricaulis TaxID=2632371 RepID=UPI001B110F72|nr:DoxX family protein [Maricaulis sp.]MBO6795614.1 DoxX family protein [Maricaulis sp.]